MTVSHARRGVLAVVALGGVALAAGGCLPAPVTTEARSVADLYVVFLMIAAVVAVVVLGLTIFALVRYRRKPGDDAPPKQVPGNLRYEAIWTAIPIATIVALLIMTIVVLNGYDDAVKAGAGVELRVTAFRWGWRFEYPDEHVVAEGFTPGGPEVYLPVGENVHVTLTGADVIHAFFVPQFLFKRDAIPGRQNIFAFTIDQAGTYRGQCAEFCGLHHSQMPFTIVAVSPADYEGWLAAHRASPSP